MPSKPILLATVAQPRKMASATCQRKGIRNLSSRRKSVIRYLHLFLLAGYLTVGRYAVPAILSGGQVKGPGLVPGKRQQGQHKDRQVATTLRGRQPRRADRSPGLQSALHWQWCYACEQSPAPFDHASGAPGRVE